MIGKRAVGVVTKVVTGKGFAFVRCEDYNVEFFVHRSELKNARIEDLTEGTRVEFDADPEYFRGARAENVSVQ